MLMEACENIYIKNPSNWGIMTIIIITIIVIVITIIIIIMTIIITMKTLKSRSTGSLIEGFELVIQRWREIHALLVGNQDFFEEKVFFVFAFKPPRVPIEGAAIICAQSWFVTINKTISYLNLYPCWLLADAWKFTIGVNAKNLNIQ